MEDEESGSLTPVEAFAILSDETRVAIVETLAEATVGKNALDELSFADLRKRVGVRDAGQFNYHLSKLQDRFVVKRDGVYYPQMAALWAVGSMQSGSYTEQSEERTAETVHDCPECGRSLTATYE